MKLNEQTVFENAAANGFPSFTRPIEGSGPYNSSPYVCSESSGLLFFSTLPGRQNLTMALQAAMCEVKSLVTVACTMIGGSFINPAVGRPNDVDVVFFYALTREAAAQGTVEPIAALSKSLRRLRIDARFVPVDSDPWVIVKLASYYTTLYSAVRDGQAAGGGLVLLTP